MRPVDASNLLITSTTLKLHTMGSEKIAKRQKVSHGSTRPSAPASSSQKKPVEQLPVPPPASSDAEESDSEQVDDEVAEEEDQEQQQEEEKEAPKTFKDLVSGLVCLQPGRTALTSFSAGNRRYSGRSLRVPQIRTTDPNPGPIDPRRTPGQRCRCPRRDWVRKDRRLRPAHPASPSRQTPASVFPRPRTDPRTGLPDWQDVRGLGRHHITTRHHNRGRHGIYSPTGGSGQETTHCRRDAGSNPGSPGAHQRVQPTGAEVPGAGRGRSTA